MNSAEQAAGEKKVQELLITPLRRLGLSRPSGMLVADFDSMVADLCSKLAYMSELNLQALVVQVTAKRAGKNKDRFPIAADILDWATDIQEPADDASPLFRAVFASPMGREAMAEGWAPELLSKIRRARVWPKGSAIREVKTRAENAHIRLQDQDFCLAQGGKLSADEQDFRLKRQIAADKCSRIAALVALEGAD